jgi:C-crk adapter molecule crk
VYRIGDQSFSDLPELLAFYKLHYLDTTPLRRPAQKKVEKVIGKFDFDGSVSTHHRRYDYVLRFTQSLFWGFAL